MPMAVSYSLNRPNQLPHIALLITYIQAQTQTCPWRPWGMHISPSHTTHPLTVLSSSGIYRIVIIMDLEQETNQTCVHVMGLSAEVLHLYLNQANLTMSGNKRALVERMLDNAIIRSNAPSKGESGDNPAGQDGTQNDDEPVGQALQSMIDLYSPA